MNATQLDKSHDTPIQFRLPKQGTVDPWWGFNRSGWNTLILPSERNNYHPPVKSVSLKQPGRRRGVRFIIFQSAKAYFDKLHKDQGATVGRAR